MQSDRSSFSEFLVTKYLVLKPLFQALYLEIKSLKSTLGAEGETTKIAITQKALHRIL